MNCKYVKIPAYILGSKWYECSKYNQIYFGTYAENRCGNCSYLKSQKRKEKLNKIKEKL